MDAFEFDKRLAELEARSDSFQRGGARHNELLAVAAALVALAEVVLDPKPTSRKALVERMQDMIALVKTAQESRTADLVVATAALQKLKAERPGMDDG